MDHAVLRHYVVLATVSRGYSPAEGRLPTRYSPVRHFTQDPKVPFSFDLHVLSPPPAFVLSQDQTLRRDLGHPEGLPRSVCVRPQTPEGVRVGGLAYVERDRRWLQQSASPDQCLRHAETWVVR